MGGRLTRLPGETAGDPAGLTAADSDCDSTTCRCWAHDGKALQTWHHDAEDGLTMAL